MVTASIETTAEFEPEWRDAAPFDEILFTLDDGREVATPRVRRATGHADTPLAPQEIWGKFLGCARQAGVEAAQAQALFDAMQRIDTLGSVQDIVLPA